MSSVAIEMTEKIRSGNFTVINIEFSNQLPKNEALGILAPKKEAKINFSFELHSSNTRIKDKLPFDAKKILLVDDSEISVMLFSCLLDEWGCKTTVTENGENAIHLAHASAYDLILMDNHMPILNGNAATAKIREFNKETPIISLTFSEANTEHNEALLAGANDSLLKPIDSSNLFKVLSKYLYK